MYVILECLNSALKWPLQTIGSEHIFDITGCGSGSGECAPTTVIQAVHVKCFVGPFKMITSKQIPLIFNPSVKSLHT